MIRTRFESEFTGGRGVFRNGNSAKGKANNGSNDRDLHGDGVCDVDVLLCGLTVGMRC